MESKHKFGAAIQNVDDKAESPANASLGGTNTPTDRQAEARASRNAMQSIQILINDEPYQLDDVVDIQTLLTKLNIGSRGTAVEVNGTVVPHERLPETLLRPGDRLEIVVLVGGG